MSERVGVVVVGGGVAGLVAALRLASSGMQVVLAEADETVGGKLRTGDLAGHPLDLGPDAFLARRPAARALCEELGLGDDLVAPGAGGAALYARGRLRPLPAGLALGVPTDLVALARSGIVPPRAVLRAAADLVLPGRAAPAHLLERLEGGGPDPTIAEVVGGRLGMGVLEALAAPLLGGINAGDPRALSFASTAPGLAALAAGRRSLLRALRRSAGASTEVARPAGPVFLGLRQGLGSLASALAEACAKAGVELRAGVAATGLARVGGRWRVETSEGALGADGIVLAAPAWCAGPLLATACPVAADALAPIPYGSVATCTLAWPREAVPAALGSDLAALQGQPAGGDADLAARSSLLPGSGFLVPRPGGSSGGLVTAVTFTSTKWPHAVPRDLVALRASVGRYGDDRHRHVDDAALAGAVAGELAAMTGITGAPTLHVVRRWPDSFPQHTSGHRARVGRARAALRHGAPGVVLAGAAYDGIGIPSCVESGETAAAELGDALG